MSAPATSSVEKNPETRQIGDQLRRLYSGPSWLGPSLVEILDGVDESLAMRRSLPDAHSIWELCLHITSWLRIARERLSATASRDPDAAENWPQIGSSWQEARAALEREFSALETAILAFPDERLDESAPAEETQTFYQLLHGVIQHTAYHAGQIAILRKTA